jgi:hypothetical protein
MTLAGSAGPQQTGAMANMPKRITGTTALLAVLYCARRYYRNWGATKAECHMRLPGDTLVRDPAIQTTEAAYLDARAAVVWSWLLQMAQDRVGFHGSEGLKNPADLGTDDSDRIRREPHQLAVGDVIRLAAEGWMGLPDGVTFSVVEIVPEKYVVLNSVQPELRWNAVVSFHLQPHWEDRVRLLARARFALRYPGEVFVMELARPLIALGTRALLLSIKHRAERLAPTGPIRSHASVETSLGEFP